MNFVLNTALFISQIFLSIYFTDISLNEEGLFALITQTFVIQVLYLLLNQEPFRRDFSSKK
jgi:hypothetical protein